MQHTSTHTINYPIRHGLVENWDNMERLWQRCMFKYLRCEPEEHYFLLTESPLNTPENREYTAEIMFETFNVPGLYIAVQVLRARARLPESTTHTRRPSPDALSMTRSPPPHARVTVLLLPRALQAVLALAASWTSKQVKERTLTGTVVDSGDGVTHVIPVADGYVIGSCIKHIPLAGRDITSFVQKLMRDRAEPIPSEVSRTPNTQMRARVITERARFSRTSGLARGGETREGNALLRVPRHGERCADPFLSSCPRRRSHPDALGVPLGRRVSQVRRESGEIHSQLSGHEGTHTRSPLACPRGRSAALTTHKISARGPEDHRSKMELRRGLRALPRAGDLLQSRNLEVLALVVRRPRRCSLMTARAARSQLGLHNASAGGGRRVHPQVSDRHAQRALQGEAARDLRRAYATVLRAAPPRCRTSCCLAGPPCSKTLAEGSSAISRSGCAPLAHLAGLCCLPAGTVITVPSTRTGRSTHAAEH